MSAAWLGAAAALGLAVGGGAGAALVRIRGGRLVRPNYRGRPVPATLGLAFTGGVLVSSGAVLAAADDFRLSPVMLALLAALVGLAVVGLLDDLAGPGPRGLRGHVKSLLAGRPTTGILKLVGGVGAGAAIAVIHGGGSLRVGAGTVLIAVSVNLWNALDVVPGRALKWGLLALGTLAAVTYGRGWGVPAAAALGAGAALLPLDLRERGMLGDSGSNPLGLIVGVGLLLALPTVGVVAAAAVGLVFQAVAETVTISRLIEAAPPFRWLDRLGRVR